MFVLWWSAAGFSEELYFYKSFPLRRLEKTGKWHQNLLKNTTALRIHRREVFLVDASSSSDRTGLSKAPH